MSGNYFSSQYKSVAGICCQAEPCANAIPPIPALTSAQRCWMRSLAARCYLELEHKLHEDERSVNAQPNIWRDMEVTLPATSVQFGVQEREKDGEEKVCVLKSLDFGLPRCFFGQVFLSEAVK